ncbi:MAG: hypothetical protein SFW09_15835 [Hyphomicrobiaceae bacterium]|nr:hypothetical protein [Hyphomicrobiaceae bacterium]
MDIARQPFVVGGAGKPRLAQSGDPIEFSFAHSESHALVALSADGPVGIDIEAARAVRISPDRRALLEAAAEALAPVPLPSGPADRRFLQAWVRLEAVAKLTGEGISALLGRLGVRSRSAAGPSSREFSDVAARSIVRDLAAGLPPQLHAAVAVPCGSRGLAGETPLVTSLPLDAGSLEALVTCRS